jgi:glycosyltransferase involved in cell wall biosynthesis
MTSCSLLIPCHNGGKFLPQLWETVQAQTVKFDQVLCYDDGSTDDSAEIAERLGMKVILGKDCRGAGFARNQLARATNCDWFHFHDADDLLDLHYLERTKSQITSDTDVVLCNVDWLDAQTHQLVIAFRYSNQELQRSPGNYLLSHPVGGINGLYRSTAFWAVGGFNESLKIWEDADLHVRLAISGARFMVIEEVLSISLRYAQTTSHDYRKNWQYRLQALQQYTRDFPTLSRQELARQAEITANNLLEFKDYSSAKIAIQLCLSLGVKPPSTNNFFLNSMKRIFSSFWLLKIQHYVRTSGVLSMIPNK